MLIAQITDLHVGHQRCVDGVDIDTEASVQAVVEHLNSSSQRPPDLVLATGDLTGDGLPVEYELLARLLCQLQMPFYLIPGNHDDRAAMRAQFETHRYLWTDHDFLHHVIDEHALRLIGLDTLVPGSNSGLMCEARLAWLADTLASAPNHPTLIYMHHPPFESCNDGACGGADALATLVRANPQVEGVVCGHLHRVMAMRWAGTMVSVAPSPVFQFPLRLHEADRMHAVVESPACVFHEWVPDRGLLSQLSYIDNVSR